MSTTYKHTIAISTEFREQITSDELDRLMNGMTIFCNDFSIRIAEWKDEVGTIWIGCDDTDQFDKLNCWCLGFFMALNFDENGTRKSK